MPLSAPLTAESTAESAKTMLGDLPPSSSVTRLSVSAELRMISLPTEVEPVKAILSPPGCFTNAAPVSGPPVTIFSTPGGRPASSANSPKRSAVSGVCSAGLSTTVLPQASAGPSFQLASSSGKFQATIAPTTPTGSRSVYVKAVLKVLTVSPWILVAHPPK